jgi:hypothetical protein
MAIIYDIHNLCILINLLIILQLNSIVKHFHILETHINNIANIIYIYTYICINFSVCMSDTCVFSMSGLYSISDLPNFNCLSCNSFNIIQVNIRSIYKNYELLSAHLNNNVHILALTECWLKPNKKIPQLPGYNSHITHSINKNGGIVVYYKFGINLNVTSITSLPNTEAISLFVADRKIQITILYRHPYGSIADFTDHLNDHLLKSLQPTVPSILLGDLNINLLNPNSSKYRNMLKSHGYLQGNISPTRL